MYPQRKILYQMNVSGKLCKKVMSRLVHSRLIYNRVMYLIDKQALGQVTYPIVKQTHGENFIKRMAFSDERGIWRCEWFVMMRMVCDDENEIQ